MLQKKIFWLTFGLIIVFIQSFFLISWPMYFWLIGLNWFFKKPWFLVLGLGLINDLLQLHFLGRSMMVFLVLSLIIQVLKQILGWSKSYQVKVSGF
jgi:hypothetical protein